MVTIQGEGYSGGEAAEPAGALPERRASADPELDLRPAAGAQLDRRAFAGALVRALATSAVVAPLAAAAGCSERQRANPRQDAALLADALVTQYQARHAYGRALPLLRPDERAQVASLRAQESEHARALARLLAQLGRKPPQPLTAAEYDAQLPTLRDRRDALVLLRDVEDLEIRTLLLALARVSDPALRRPALALAAAEAAQAMALANLAGARAPQRPFVTGRPRQ